MRIGARELKNRMGRYLEAVRGGKVVYVTDRGRVIAELRRAERSWSGEAAALQALAAEGDVVLGSGRFDDFAPHKLRRRGRPASAVVIEDRG